MLKEKLTNLFFKNLNAYTLLQLIWLIAINYFLIISLFNILKPLTLSDTFNSKIETWNAIILSTIDTYKVPWIIMSSILVITGIIMLIVIESESNKYSLILSYGAYSLNVGLWSFRIIVDYLIFTISKSFFPLVITTIALLKCTSTYEKIKSHIISEDHF